MDHETLGGRIPKGERRVRFADSMGMELVSIFLTDLFVLASHTPYTNYNEHRKPPSSRLSSTLQAIQYSHDHHHNHHHSSNSHSQSKSIISAASKATSNNYNKQAINYNNNNNNHFNSFNNYHTSGYHNRGQSATYADLAQCNKQQRQHQSSQLPPPVFKQSAAAAPHATSAAAAVPPSLPPAPSAPTEFICEFTQPVSLISFKERVKLKKVHLENCYVNTTAGHVSLTCNIRVLNVSYDKSVSVRYTTDEWASHTDSLASYKPGSSDGWSDQFTSTISIINKLQPGQRIIFAVRFISNGVTFWDNNGGLNYSVKSKCDRSN